MDLKPIKKNNNSGSLSILIVIFLLLVIILLLFYAVNRLDKEGRECRLNPLVYGAKQLEDLNNATIMCSCSLATKGISPTVNFNSKQLKVDNPDDISFYMGEELKINK